MTVWGFQRRTKTPLDPRLREDYRAWAVPLPGNSRHHRNHHHGKRSSREGSMVRDCRAEWWMEVHGNRGKIEIAGVNPAPNPHQAPNSIDLSWLCPVVTVTPPLQLDCPTSREYPNIHLNISLTSIILPFRKR
jgi:hypothetical protein